MFKLQVAHLRSPVTSVGTIRLCCIDLGISSVFMQDIFS